MTNAERINSITERLTLAFKPNFLHIEDQSHRHQNHPGAQDGRGHFAVTISADIFQEESLITAHRLIYQSLNDLMQTEIHALSIIIQKK